MSDKNWKLGLPHRDRRNGGEFLVLHGVGEGWIADIRCGSKSEEANCKLIVAAPILLAACKDAVRDASSAVNPSARLPNYNEMVDAIAKAETT
jgi:hypothetical protein